MPDIGERYTEQAYDDLRRRLRQVYSDAQRDIAAKAASFERGHRERVKKHLKEVREGKITKADYEAWMRGQVFQREQWQKKREQIAQIMTRADEQAMAMLNDGRIDVFAENANFMGWNMERGTGADFGFGVYSQKAVKRMVRDNPDLLPRPRVDKGKDYAWYNRIVNDAVTQGIMQGEELSDIMLRIANDTGERSISAMLRNARTAYTGAQNAGREDAMQQVRAKGVRVQKEWAANHDSSTREAHAELDGKRVDIDEPFDSMLGPIMYPGDPGADPANVYNCRCSLIEHFPDYPDSSGEAVKRDTRENRSDYKTWKRGKQRGGAVFEPSMATWINGPRSNLKPGEKYHQETRR